MTNGTPTIHQQLDMQAIRAQAKAALGNELAQLLADHDAALMHHATEITRMREQADKVLSQFVEHAAEMERRLRALEAAVAPLVRES